MKKIILILIIGSISFNLFSINYNNNYQDGLTHNNVLAYMTECEVYMIRTRGEYIFVDIRKPNRPETAKMFNFKKSDTATLSILMAAKMNNSRIKAYFQYSNNQTPVEWLGEVSYHFLYAVDLL